METENKPFFRFPAEKILIGDLEEGEYIEEKEHNPNYILIDGNKKIFRINIIATLVHKEIRGSATSILVDDGSGKIVLRVFEEHKTIMDLEVGDVIQVIGKMRIFNQEKYIFPEIIKKTNPAWLKVRYLELQKDEKESEEKNRKQTQNTKEIIKEAKKTNQEKRIEEKIDPKIDFEVINEEIEENIEDNDPLLPYEKLSKLIAGLDKGEGVLIEEIITKSPLEKTEELIEKMLENGDIFQNLPGKVRLL